MAVANTKSIQITNDDAILKVFNDRRVSQGLLMESVATVEIAAADDDGSVYRFVRVHSSWRISQITLFNDAITSGTAFDCGLYQTLAGGGAVLLDNCYADNASMVVASKLGTELYFQNHDIANIEQYVYQDGGLSTDPNKFYDICLTGDTVGSAAGTLSMRVRFIKGS